MSATSTAWAPPDPWEGLRNELGDRVITWLAIEEHAPYHLPMLWRQRLEGTVDV